MMSQKKQDQLNTEEKALLTALVYSDQLQKSDAVICLEGDGYNRLKPSVNIWSQGLAEKIVLSGGFSGQRPFTIPAEELAQKLRGQVPEEKIVIESKSQNTKEQATEIMKIAKKENWYKIILVASHFHQPRAYLTFLKARLKANLNLLIFNAPVKDLSWFKKTSLEKNRLELLKDELIKISEYAVKGHLASFKDVLKHEHLKEKN